MTIRQYIGARYVPKFYENPNNTSEWLPNVIYEPLTIVTYSNNSYTSKKTVPASIGNPANNPEYWVATGIYNAFIEELQSQINDMKDSDVEGSLQNQIDTMKDGEVEGSLQNQIVTTNTNIEALKRNILIIGNSYVDRGCANALASVFVHNYKYTSGGVGFVTYTGHTTTFESLVDSAINDTTLDKDSITDIIFVSAMGDTRSYEESSTNYINDLKTTLESINTKLIANFPNLKFKKITLAEIRDQWGWSNNRYVTLFKVHSTFKSLSETYGFTYIGWSGFNSLYVANCIDEDHYHPTTQGAKSIGNWILGAYFGNVSYNKKLSVGSAAFNYCSNGHITSIYEFTPDRVDIFLRRASVTQNAAVTIQTGETLIDFNDLSIPCPPPAYDIDIFAPLVRSDTGVSADMLSLTITSDSTSGRAIVKINNNPNASTVLSSYLTMVGFNHISYMP